MTGNTNRKLYAMPQDVKGTQKRGLFNPVAQRIKPGADKERTNSTPNRIRKGSKQIQIYIDNVCVIFHYNTPITGLT